MSKDFEDFLSKEFMHEAVETTEKVLEDDTTENLQLPFNMYHAIMKKIEHYEDKSSVIRWHKPKNFKVWIAVASMLVLVLGLSITSVGAREYLLDITNKFLGNTTSVTINTNVAETKKVDRVKEFDAYREIHENFSTQIPRLEYLPSNLIFDSATIDSQSLQATLYYLYENTNLITYTIVSKQIDTSFSFSCSDPLLEEYQLKSIEHIFSIKKYQVANSTAVMMAATFSDENVYYSISGIIDESLFKKIILNVYFTN